MDGGPIKEKNGGVASPSDASTEPASVGEGNRWPDVWARRDMRVGTVRMSCPRPDGVATALDFFVRRFPRQGPEVWRRRFERGMVFTQQGPLKADAPYVPGLEVRYGRELDKEWPVRRDYRIVHHDRDILVVDKPPFLPVTPAGHYLENCLLCLLLSDTGLQEVSPLHRLDKDTSGLVVFSTRQATRALFQGLFRPPCHHVGETYLALCEAADGAPAMPERATLAGHVARDPEAYYRQRIFADRPPNSVCEVERLEQVGAGRALVRVRPATGRKHQIRVQLSHAGWPIAHDRIYGLAPRHEPHDIATPMLLTCVEIRIDRFAAPDGSAVVEGKWVSRFRPCRSGALVEGA